MGGFGDFSKREKKKKKNGKSGDAQAFSSRPVFVAPARHEKEKREK